MLGVPITGIFFNAAYLINFHLVEVDYPFKQTESNYNLVKTARQYICYHDEVFINECIVIVFR